jgi:hypothetical protein
MRGIFRGILKIGWRAFFSPGLTWFGGIFRGILKIGWRTFFSPGWTWKKYQIWFLNSTKTRFIRFYTQKNRETPQDIMYTNTIVTLQVNDNYTKTVNTTLAAAQQSILLKGLFEEMESGFVGEITEAIPVYVQDTDEERALNTLKVAVSFMEYQSVTPMKEIQKPLFMTLRECVGDQFFNIVGSLDYSALGYLMSLAAYLNIPGLTELIAARLAEMIRDITPQQLAVQLGVNYRDVISEEEEAAVRKRVEDSLAQYN